MMEHSKTPWEVSISNGTTILSHRGDSLRYIIAEVNDNFGEESEANAGHIVKCVNHFDELVKCLKDALQALGWEGFDKDIKPHPNTILAIKLLEQLLAKVENNE